ncbi:unnamed protein product [Paramecium primaurelia]|uniref:Uncharacterized protein n=1 Tax=Paramecium primaurelia TaxID=5886 RepID=A0A8S1M4H0_PARPR|nr:unnamed protein product [Paramecium primaurelia]
MIGNVFGMDHLVLISCTFASTKPDDEYILRPFARITNHILIVYQIKQKKDMWNQMLKCNYCSIEQLNNMMQNLKNFWKQNLFIRWLQMLQKNTRFRAVRQSYNGTKGNDVNNVQLHWFRQEFLLNQCFEKCPIEFLIALGMTQLKNVQMQIQEVSQQFHNNSKTKCSVNSVSKCVDKLACIQYAIACQCYIDNNVANCTGDTKPQKNADDQKNFITHAYVQLNLIKAPSLIHHGDLKKVLLVIIEMKKFVWEQSLEIKLNVN